MMKNCNEEGANKISVRLANGVTISVEVEEGATATEFLEAVVEVMEYVTYAEATIAEALDEVGKNYGKNR